jgi:hypothetical protein
LLNYSVVLGCVGVCLILFCHSGFPGRLGIEEFEAGGDHLGEGNCIEVTPSLQAVMAENKLLYAYREDVDFSD